jgi:uncharacterized membrane-anchored protein
MKNKKWLAVLGIVFLAQLFVPAKMAYNQEDILKTGKLFKFRTEPIDPSDPFRGKYVSLDFANSDYTVKNADKWNKLDFFYAILGTRPDGFAKVVAFSVDKPQEGDYVKVGRQWAFGKNVVHISFPFDRFYMNEHKAPMAEKLYLKATVISHSTDLKPAYAKVYIKNGGTVLDDVIVDGKSLREISIEQK